MNKTATVIAMSCALACPPVVDARQCGAGQPLLRMGAPIVNADKSISQDVHIAGRTTIELKELERDYNLKGALLEPVGAMGVRERLETTDTRAGVGDSVCLVFNRRDGSNHSIAGVNLITGLKGGDPELCIGPDGALTSSLRFSGLGGEIGRVFLRVRSKHGPDAEVFEADADGCNALCPSGESTLLVESTTKKEWRSSEAVVAIVGRAPVTLKELQAGYNLKNSILIVGDRSAASGDRPPLRLMFNHLREKPNGTVCMVFDSYAKERDGLAVIKNLTDVEHPEPNVCINTGGLVEAKFKIEIGSLALDPYVEVRMWHRTEDKELTLIDADKDGCKPQW